MNVTNCGAEIKRKWQRKLYIEQPYEDNYVDETFLHNLQTNLYSRTYNFWPVVRESGVVTQQISSVCLFVVLFVYMDQQLLSAEVVILISSCISILAYIIYHCVPDYTDPPTQPLTPIKRHRRRHWSSGSDSSDTGGGMFCCVSEVPRTYVDDLKTAVLFILFTFAMSGVLMTLTDTISTDTIYAMTTCLLLANLFFHDYGANAALVSQSLSVNASLFASVCLASRLHTILHTFATVIVAMEIFALGPLLRKRLKAYSDSLQNLMTISSGVITSLALYTISPVSSVTFIGAHLFVNILCPAWLMQLQSYKHNIHGPWDEAVVKEKTA